MELPGGRDEGKPAPECDEEEKMATASSLEEGPGGHLKNKHMGQIPQDRENGQNVAFLDALASLDLKLSVSGSGMFLQLAHLRVFQIYY